MKPTRLILFTALALAAFAGNSLICRFALQHTRIDAATFTSLRIVAGALCLGAIGLLRRAGRPAAGSWRSALPLFIYAASFSFAYLRLSAGTGALVLFAAVQITMIVWGFVEGERLRPWQAIGFVVAFGGLILLLLPGLSAPPWQGAALMLAAGIAWGVYSLRGKRTVDPAAATTGNFLRAVPMTAILSLAFLASFRFDSTGAACAIVSGAITSGLGYIVWYAVLPALRASTAATVQLIVPVLAAAGGVLFLGEPPTLRLVSSAVAVLGGIALVIRKA
ncbi:MAG: DMT family transporter [Verrucomicrobiota bacterium]